MERHAITVTANKARKVKTFTPKYSLEDFCKGRQHRAAHRVLMGQFCPVIVTQRVWARQLRQAKGIDDVCTVSDEAFALLALENMWERWVDINNKMCNRFRQISRHDVTKPTRSEIDPKYTSVYISGVTENDKGWTDAGIKRFNALFDQVEQDRKDNAKFDADWLREQQTSLRPTKKARVESIQPQAKSGIHFKTSDDEKDDEKENQKHNLASDSDSD